MHRGSLVVVGLGINGIPQTTAEAVAFMERAEQLFYLAIDPISDVWLQRLNPTAQTLFDLYVPGKSRQQTYREMTDRITAAVFRGKRVCAAFYGHPGVLVRAAHEAVRQVQNAGCPAHIVPGVSADACLYADLGIDPGTHGVQSYETTDFLLFRRRPDPTSALILWQVGVIGETITRDPRRSYDRSRMRVLVDKLQRYYPASHRVVLYQAAIVPGTSPRVRRAALGRLDRAAVAPLSMLYVPPLAQRRPDREVLEWLRVRTPDTAGTGAAADVVPQGPGMR